MGASELGAEDVILASNISTHLLYKLLMGIAGYKLLRSCTSRIYRHQFYLLWCWRMTLSGRALSELSRVSYELRGRYFIDL